MISTFVKSGTTFLTQEFRYKRMPFRFQKAYYFHWYTRGFRHAAFDILVTVGICVKKIIGKSHHRLGIILNPFVDPKGSQTGTGGQMG